MSHSLRIRALLGDDFEVTSERGYWLALCRAQRAMRSWINPGCYAWWRYTDYLKAAQGQLVRMRAERRA